MFLRVRKTPRTPERPRNPHMRRDIGPPPLLPFDPRFQVRRPGRTHDNSRKETR
jgi:hypothetical protein